MSEFKLPHVEDLRTDATLIRGLQEDFKAIEQVVTDIYGEIDKLNNRISDVENELKKLESSDINTEYITDTNVVTDYTTDAPTSVDIDDTNGDDEVQGLTIQEGGK